MRHLIILLSGLILFSCGEESTDNETELPTEIVAEEDTIAHDFYVPEDPIKTNFEMGELPSEWILLTETENLTLAIYDYWDAQEMGLEFYQDENEVWKMDVAQAQDTEIGVVSNFTAEATDGEGIAVVKGSFDYTLDYNDETRRIDFEYDKFNQLCNFVNSGIGSEYFVPTKNKDLYEIVVFEREED